jgi:membrane-associated protease RseP (regulator of RpoE activity)
MTALGIIAFIAVLLGSVMFHEWGHFATARRFGMKATQFFVGFGPTLWSTQRGETEYGVKAVPAGGFVRIVGMTPDEPVAPADEERAFWRQPAGRRAVVLVAGSAMHLVLAAVLIVVALSVVGTAQPTTTIGQVAACIPESTEECTDADPPSPAAAAGIVVGDQVVSVAGESVAEWSQVTDAIRGSAGRPLAMTLSRDGSARQLSVVPVAVERTDDSGVTATVGVIGLVPQAEVVRSNPVSAVGDALRGIGSLTVATAEALWSLPSKIPDLIGQTFGGQPRDETDLVGPVGIAQGSVAVLSGELPLAARISAFLLLMAGVNVFIGWFNLLPLLPLDGGHLAVLGWESLRRWWARRRGDADPGPVDVTRLAPVAYTVLGLLVALSLLLLTADIVNPVDLDL